MKGHLLLEHLLALLVAVSAPMANFIAEVTVPELPAWAGNLPATAILGWYAWHTTTKTIPELLRDHRTEMQIEREARQRQHDEYMAHLRDMKQALDGRCDD